uniref:C2H2-type domain-containing protein n=2 Tax=Lutzomyia longipalpis TaxID=7200 RepID=A0A1B0CFQ0_LUTLO
MYYYHHMNVEYVKNEYKLFFAGGELPSDEVILETVSLFESTGSIHISHDMCMKDPFEMVEVEGRNFSVEVKSEPEELGQGDFNVFQEESSEKLDVPMKEEDSDEYTPIRSRKLRKSKKKATVEGKEETEEQCVNKKEQPEDMEEEKPTFSCKDCNLTFNVKTQFAKHLRTHPPKEYTCEKCGKKYKKKNHAEYHMKICHGDYAEEFRCNIEGCGKVLKCKENLKRHQRIHKARNFVCDVCGGRFINQRNMEIHMRTHTGARPYECDICHKKFASTCTLRIHIRYHTGERPYKCDFCDNAFVDKQTMIVHRRQHTGEQPYSCPYEDCNRFFKQKQNLRSHLKHIHHVQSQPNATKPFK